MRFQAPESLSEQIAQYLGLRIIRGDLKPNERIPEQKIAAELNVSRGSVREALLLLERRHLIDVLPRRGAVVSPLSPQLVSALYDMYIGLLTMLMTRVASKLSPVELESLFKVVREINRQASAEKVEFEGLMKTGFEFIDTCCEVAANPYLQETIASLQPALSRTYYIALSRQEDATKYTKSFFSDLVPAIQQQDTVKITRIIKSYVEHQKVSVLHILAQIADDAALLG